MGRERLDRFASRRSTVYGTGGAVATSQPLAAEAGLDVLRDGGNAFDAAVTTAATLNVVEPTSTGLGGDVFALYRMASGEVGAMRSCGGAPEAATTDAVRERIAADREVDPGAVEMPLRGAHTVTVPGTARGWEALVNRFGDRSFEAVLSPAVGYARDGYPVSEIIADHWSAAEELFTDEHARRAYLPGGRAPRTGEVVTLPALGDSLERIADLGADDVYEGAIADAIVTEVQTHGGLLDHDDLERFTPEFIDPLSARYRDATVYELPANNQGPIALEALRIAEQIDAGEFGYDTVERIHRFVEATKLAFHDGHRYITDPAFETIPPLTDDDWIADRATRVDDGVLPTSDLPPPAPRGEHADTVLVTVADGAGRLVSLINSRFHGFGSGLVAGETGIALQNRGTSFSLDPDHPNHIAPGKRPFHTLIPGLVQLDTDDWAAFGVMGGHMQPQGHVQVLSNILDYDMALQPALDAPRWRHLANGRLAIEPRFDDVLQLGLRHRGHDVMIDRLAGFGGAQIVRNRDGVLSGATEPRKDGVVAVF